MFKVLFEWTEGGLKRYAGHVPQGTGVGYVELPKGHPWWGLVPQDLGHVSIHGGITYSYATVHPEGQDETEESWYVGFDTAHAFDQPNPDWIDDKLKGFHERWPSLSSQGNVWDEDRLIKHVEMLAKLADVAMDAEQIAKPHPPISEAQFKRLQRLAWGMKIPSEDRKALQALLNHVKDN